MKLIEGEPTADILFSCTKAIETSAWLTMNSTAFGPVMSKITELHNQTLLITQPSGLQFKYIDCH